MKIGVLAQYLDSRNDIRDLLLELNKNVEVVVFIRSADSKQRGLLNSIKFRTIEIINNRRIRNAVWKYLFMFFGKIPTSSDNYLFAEKAKLLHRHVSIVKRVIRRISLISTRLCNYISFDRYLSKLNYQCKTPLADIDVFLVISEVYDDRFLSILLKMDKPVLLYVYSWDHPCKMKTFSHVVKKYMVWNEGLREDMVQLQNIQPSKIEVVGATQLAYITEYNSLDRKFRRPKKYVYFACAFGYEDLVSQELNYIKTIASILHHDFPDVDLVVRPYPFLRNWDLYSELKSIPNICFDDQFRAEDPEKVFLTRGEIFDKFDLMSEALAFFHLGTTMGMECAYFRTPIIHINYYDNQYFGKMLNQYHNVKYLIKRDFPNIVVSYEDLRIVIRDVIYDKKDYLNYNRKVASETKIRSISEIAKSMVTLCQDTL